MTTNDPENYRRCAEPFPTTEAANEALTAFFAEVKAARDKHRIADVVVLCEISHTVDGEEVRGGALSSHGDSARILPMLAPRVRRSAAKVHRPARADRGPRAHVGEDPEDPVITILLPDYMGIDARDVWPLASAFAGGGA